MKTVQTRDIAVQVIFRHQLWAKTYNSRKIWQTTNE